jgi:hypothetical protein
LHDKNQSLAGIKVKKPGKPNDSENLSMVTMHKNMPKDYSKLLKPEKSIHRDLMGNLINEDDYNALLNISKARVKPIIPDAYNNQQKFTGCFSNQYEHLGGSHDLKSRADAVIGHQVYMVGSNQGQYGMNPYGPGVAGSRDHGNKGFGYNEPLRTKKRGQCRSKQEQMNT